jgi:hypothetical protein
MGTTKKFFLEPDWEKIESIRNKSADFFYSHKISDETIYSLSMVISELIENGIKYGHYVTKKNLLTVIINVKNKTITIEVIHPINNSTLKKISNLDKMIQWIRGFQDPFEAYVERLKEVSKKPLFDKESGIGLVRIAYEGNAILDFIVNKNNMLNVSAIANLD